MESSVRTWATLLGIVLGFIVFNPLAVYCLHASDGPSIFVATFIGGIAVQPVLFGLWAGLGSGSYLIRLPGLATAALAVVFSVALPISQNDRQEISLTEPVAGLGALFAAIFAVSALLAVFLRWWTQQSVQHSIAGLQAAEQELRFSMRYLLGLTTLCALLAAIVGRIFSQGLDISLDDMSSRVLIGLATAGMEFAVCVPTIFIPWIILSPLPRAPFVGVAVAFWILWTLILIALVSRLTGSRADEPFEILIGSQIGAVLLSAAAAGVLRVAGFRLVFHKPGAVFNPIAGGTTAGELAE